jgi:hypothetical protein
MFSLKFTRGGFRHAQAVASRDTEGAGCAADVCVGSSIQRRAMTTSVLRTSPPYQGGENEGVVKAFEAEL